MSVLDTHATVLNPEMRMSLVKALMMLSSKKLVPSQQLLPLCFKLFRVHDKELRKLVYQHIVQDIKRHNTGKKNLGLNKHMQNYMFTMLQDASEIAQKKSLDVMIDLYRRGIWKDAKTVNVIAQACLSEGKVVAPALRFFIDPNNLNPEDDEEADRKRKNQKLPVPNSTLLPFFLVSNVFFRTGAQAVFSALQGAQKQKAQNACGSGRREKGGEA